MRCFLQRIIMLERTWLKWWYSSLALVLALAGVGCGNGAERSQEDNAKVISLTPLFTGFDCDFGKDEPCLWTWEGDNFTDALVGSGIWPGQNGFYRMNGKDIGHYHMLSKAKGEVFFGPKQDSSGLDSGKRKKQLNVANMLKAAPFVGPLKYARASGTLLFVYTCSIVPPPTKVKRSPPTHIR